MKHLHTFESFLNEKRKETGLTFTTLGPVDATKMRDALDDSGLHYEWNAREGYFFFPEEEDNYDDLELEIQKIADITATSRGFSSKPN